MLSQGTYKLIGSREDILVWEDPWIPDSPSFRPSPRVPTETQQCITVAKLMVQDKLAWDESILQSLFDDSTIAAIQNIPRWSKVQNDKWSWLFSTNGTLTVKSAYKVATKEENSAHSNTILGNIWKSSIHDRLKILLWRIALNILPTKSSIALFASNLDTNCPLYSIHVETPLHLFWQCPLARALWFNSV